MLLGKQVIYIILEIDIYCILFYIYMPKYISRKLYKRCAENFIVLGNKQASLGNQFLTVQNGNLHYIWVPM